MKKCKVKGAQERVRLGTRVTEGRSVKRIPDGKRLFLVLERHERGNDGQ